MRSRRTAERSLVSMERNLEAVLRFCNFRTRYFSVRRVAKLQCSLEEILDPCRVMAATWLKYVTISSIQPKHTLWIHGNSILFVQQILLCEFKLISIWCLCRRFKDFYLALVVKSIVLVIIMVLWIGLTCCLG